MKVRMLRDWGWYTNGQIAELFDPVAVGYIKDGFAEAVSTDSRSVRVDDTMERSDGVEQATVVQSRRQQNRR